MGKIMMEYLDGIIINLKFMMSLFGPRMWPKWVVFCLNFAN